MSWFDFGGARRREQDAHLKALQTLIDSQARMAEAIVGAVKDITSTQAKQIEAINTHLSLFKTVEAPSATSMTGHAENKAWAEQNGFPFEGSADEIAKWIEAHDTDD